MVLLGGLEAKSYHQITICAITGVIDASVTACAPADEDLLPGEPSTTMGGFNTMNASDPSSQCQTGGLASFCLHVESRFGGIFNQKAAAISSTL